MNNRYYYLIITFIVTITVIFAYVPVYASPNHPYTFTNKLIMSKGLNKECLTSGVTEEDPALHEVGIKLQTCNNQTNQHWSVIYSKENKIYTLSPNITINNKHYCMGYRSGNKFSINLYPCTANKSGYGLPSEWEYDTKQLVLKDPFIATDSSGNKFNSVIYVDQDSSVSKDILLVNPLYLNTPPTISMQWDIV